MLHQLQFYLRHSWNDLRVNRQRTLFALLCITAGVAAIVSLRMLGGMVQEALDTSYQQQNRGDISLKLPPMTDDKPEAQLAQGVQDGVLKHVVSGFGSEEYFLSPDGLEKLKTWFEQSFPGQLAAMTYRQQVVRPDRTAINAPVSGMKTSGITPFVIEAAAFPLYGNTTTIDGKPLGNTLNAPTDIVLNQELARKLMVQPGDTVQISGASADFTVRAIVPDGAAGGDNPSLAQSGYIYLDVASVSLFDQSPAAHEVYIKLADPALAGEVDTALEQHYPYLVSTSTADIAMRNSRSGAQMNLVATMMGLLALLIGGIGIINTMQVIVRRRMLEVAVLKTLGLQGRQITLLFMVEALIMGVIGSLAGVLLGLLISYIAKDVAAGLTVSNTVQLGEGNAATYTREQLAYRVSFGPILMGFLTGVVVTTVFGFLPVLSATRVRPATVLRPTETITARAGWGQMLLAISGVVLVMALVASVIVGNLLIGLIIVSVTFLLAGVIYALLAGLITLIGRFFPAFGSVDLRVALRSMAATRARGALTLLALTVGAFAISLILLVTTTVSTLVARAVEKDMGGNIIAMAGSETGQKQLARILNELDGVKRYTMDIQYQVILRRVETTSGKTLTLNDLKAQLQQQGVDPIAANFSETVGELGGLELQPDALNQRILSGRQLTAEDAGKAVVVMPMLSNGASTGVNVGDTVTFVFGGAEGIEQAYEVVGIYEPKFAGFGAGTTAPYAPRDSFPVDAPPLTFGAKIDIEASHIGTLRERLKRVPGLFLIEARELNQAFQQLFDQFAVFPIVVGAISLLVGGIVIANSVALSTLERRREIAVMKAVGLQRERVLGMLLTENGILGLLGGLVGVGLALLALLVILSQPIFAAVQDAISIPYLTAGGLMMLCVFVALVAALLSAWGAAGEKPLQVLRYD